MWTPEEIAALTVVVQAFPGTLVMPRLHGGGGVLATCVVCDHVTALRDDDEVPYHQACKLAAVGLV